MAIQIPNPGTGNGATGDNEFVLWSKVKGNFSDQTNAASRLVGSSSGEIPLAEEVSVAIGIRPKLKMTTDIDSLSGGIHNIDAGQLSQLSWGDRYTHIIQYETVSNGYDIQMAYPTISTYSKSPRYRIRQAGVWQPWNIFYNTGNTTKDSNGFIKAASPIVKVFADKAEFNGEAEDQNVAYKKNGIGDYTITTQSGLSTDGWYIELPKDMNGNPKVAVTLQETNGVISLKSYKRIFSMETFTFEPDLDNPLDVPDGRWIDLRLNEIPVENLDDVQTEV